MLFLNHIREKEPTKPLGKQIAYGIFILVFGVALGFFSKFLDSFPSNRLPGFLEELDVRNFLGRFAVWVLIGLWLSVSSRSPGQAAVHVFLFFFGMVSAYYLYSASIAGFFPRSYAMVWFGFTAVSPLLAVLCWYAGGKGIPSFALSVILLAVLFWCSFVGGGCDVRPRSLLELLTFFGGLAVLQRNSLKGTAFMTLLGIGLGFVLLSVVPFHFG